ncbi:MAG: peptidoglycan DD-metalloendopeptidase family protein, partial [Bacteroidales bacterium]|nr:peptidoglycan DD-metalloendopeptidase family protein [Bacteroidales bacterium]
LITMLRRINIFSIVFLLLALLATNSLYSQDKKEKLEEEKNRIEKEIQYTNKLLNETKRSKKNSLNQLIILNKKIKTREKLVSTINHEMNNLDKNITKNETEIKVLTKDLKKLKDEYAKMIYYAFKNRNAYNRLMFIFASEDFNQAFQRLKYFQQYSSYRRMQAKLIEKTQTELNNKADQLKNQKLKKTSLLKEKAGEIKQLKREKDEKNSTIRKLSGKEKELRSTLKAKKNEASKLEKAIKNIINAEIKAAAERARKTNEVKKSKIIDLTSEEFELTNNFVDNKGKLPWPSEKGIISSTFGEHKHPVLRKVKIKNNGIDILTNKGEMVRAIFNGTVISVRAISNTNTVIIIRHGEYFTVYSNLDKVFVKRGDKVQIKQEIGTVFTNPSDSKTELHFEIWKGRSLLNPIYWVVKKD